jgi:hypothetical protein
MTAPSRSNPVAISASTPRAATKPRVEFGRYALSSAMRNTPTRRNERVERARP